MLLTPGKDVLLINDTKNDFFKKENQMLIKLFHCARNRSSLVYKYCLFNFIATV